MLSIKYHETKKIIPYVNNSRTHSDHQIKQVAASIKEFGFTNPILVDESYGVIAGHGRLMAAEILEMGKVPTIMLKGLTEAQRKAYVIADNKIALNSGWDDALLKVELEGLMLNEFDIDLLGWDVLPDFGNDLDLSILDDEELEEDLDAMTKGVKKAIQIEFESDHYEEAAELVKFWRGEGAYIGAMLIELLRNEKAKL